jgi:hypothetical protein
MPAYNTIVKAMQYVQQENKGTNTVQNERKQQTLVLGQ